MVGGETVIDGSIIVGIGFSSKATEDEILALIDDALERLGAARKDIGAIAMPCFKRDAPVAMRVAERLDVALSHVDDEALRAVQDRCVTRSTTVENATGLASVAEAAALAVAGAHGRLVLPRLANAVATCALAVRAAVTEETAP